MTLDYAGDESVTILRMEVFDLPDILTTEPDIIIGLIPRCEGCNCQYSILSGCSSFKPKIST